MSKTSLSIFLLFVIGCGHSGEGGGEEDAGGLHHIPDASSPHADAGRPIDAGIPITDAGHDAGHSKDAGRPPTGGGQAEPDQDAGEVGPVGGAGGTAGTEPAGEAGAGGMGGDCGCAGQGGESGQSGEMGGTGGMAGADGSAGQSGSAGAAGGGEMTMTPQIRVIREHLNFPWEIVWGPDNYLWLTERTSFQVDRINPRTGERRVALELSDGYQVGGQDGLLGMALDPGLLQNVGKDYVYISYTYNAADPAATPERRQKIVRYTYNATTELLENPLPLILGLPASLDHNGGRLIYGPDDKLYYTIGDQGANQYVNVCQLNKAQTLPTAPLDFANYPGKTLRINPDGSVPVDNPMLAGVRSHVFTYGHRNPQGISFAPNGLLYESEHGPKSDDEINLLATGQNYGWPWVSGYQDDKAYAYREWGSSSVPCETLTYSDYSVPPSVPTQTETSISSQGLTAPLFTMFTVDSDFMFLDPDCDAVGSFLCWPTIAPGSLVAYEGPLWPGISLIVPSLKHGLLYRFSVTGAHVDEMISMTETTTSNRYRDVAVSPDGTSIYVITDVTGASYVSQGASFNIANPGAILEFHYN